MKQSKNSASSYIVFLNTFLIFSTVIVFAVLLFLSYQNIYNDLISSVSSDVEKTLSDIQNDCTYMDEDGIYNYLNMSAMSDSGNIYVIDDSGSLIYSREPITSASLLQSEELDDLASEINDRFTESSETVLVDTYRETSFVWVTGYTRMINGEYFIVRQVISTNDILHQYGNSILIPAIISLIIAIILFVVLVTITSRPLHEMSKVISKVAEGDFSARVDEKYTNTNELSMYTVSSDLAEMAKTLNEMLEIVDNQEKDRNVFISGLAHDIRTPLTSINGFITAMLDGTIPPESQEKYLNIIKEQVDRIRSLVVSMTEASSLSHIDPSMMEEFNIEEVITDVVENLEPQLNEKNIKISAVIDNNTDNMVYGEAQQLCRVIFNIVTNAIKFTPNGGKIRITTKPDRREGKMYISVEDSGPGVEKEKRNRVFESFYKADSSRTKEGFGLGLHICKQILIGHGQGITLDESADLGGANFTFSFPLPPKKGLGEK